MTGKRIHEMFDLIAGTSTGGLIALLLSLPSKEFTAQGVYELYMNRACEIFQRRTAPPEEDSTSTPTPDPETKDTSRPKSSQPQPASSSESDITQWLSTLAQGAADNLVDWGKDAYSDLRNKSMFLHNSKYTEEGLMNMIDSIAGGQTLRDCITPVFIGAYEAQESAPYFFSSIAARNNPEECDWFLRDVARATTAAPILFPPCEARPVHKADDAHCFLDGALCCNSPALAAFLSIRLNFPPDTPFLVVSLGTGNVPHPVKYDEAKEWGLMKWAMPLLRILMDASTTIAHQQLQLLVPPAGLQRYFRFQMNLPPEFGELDNSTDEFLLSLTELGEEYIQSQLPRLQSIAGVLSKD
eukprot:TRINITY_DN63317_c0_g2_i1.p1 TRINITY_DN63317_c0_g2~~TRINITY_DN63317_c0_g2_i1.p1  ORF type:complete len:355 (-),score=43.18 TRINITY_DN63317_c0_g2_i1:119-1183(-)